MSPRRLTGCHPFLGLPGQHAPAQCQIEPCRGRSCSNRTYRPGIPAVAFDVPALGPVTVYHRKELRRKAFWDTRTDTQAVDRPGPAPDVRAGPTSYIDTGEHVVGLQQIQAAVFPY